jgi:hypothetical protein
MNGRLVVLGLAVAGLLASPGSAAASHDPSGAPVGEDFAVGHATILPSDPIGITLDAHSGPDGQDPTGWAEIVQRQSFLGGPVTCLHVDGNRATIAGGGPAFRSFLFVVEDNAATGQPDRFENLPFPIDGPPLTDCSIAVPAPTSPIISGDLVVHDSPALPVSKDECKNGGWQSYGSTFNNQGQCVAFVQRGAKPGS